MSQGKATVLSAALWNQQIWLRPSHPWPAHVCAAALLWFSWLDVYSSQKSSNFGTFDSMLEDSASLVYTYLVNPIFLE
jgi:hypothetical protein